MSYFFKTIVKDSKKNKNGTIKLKIIKTIKFESILLENNKKININDVPKDAWVKILLEIHSIIINNENKTFYLFLRPHAFSFKDKEIKSNYNFLEDSDSNEEIPDSDINNLFLKQTNVDKNNKSNENQTSSQINYNIKNLELLSKSNFSSTSSSSDSDKKSLKKLSDSPDSDKESLKKLSDSQDSQDSQDSSDSDKESLKQLSDSDDSSDSDKESLKQLSDSEKSIKDKENINLGSILVKNPF